MLYNNSVLFLLGALELDEMMSQAGFVEPVTAEVIQQYKDRIAAEAAAAALEKEKEKEKVVDTEIETETERETECSSGIGASKRQPADDSTGAISSAKSNEISK